MLWLRFGSLKTRMVVLTTLSLGVLLAVVLLITNDIGRTSIRRGVEVSLSDAGAVFVNLLRTHQNELLTMAQVTAKDPRFFVTFSIPEDERGEEFGPTVEGVAREFLLITGADFVEVYDRHARPVAVVDRAATTGGSATVSGPTAGAGDGSLRASMAGRPSTDVYSRGNALVVAAAVPVTLGDHLEAVLRIGQALDARFVEQVERLTGASVCLARDGVAYASTFPAVAPAGDERVWRAAPEATLQPADERAARSGAFALRLGDVSYLTVHVQVDGMDPTDGLDAFLGRELAAEMAPVVTLEKKMAAVGVAALLATLAASWVLAASITKPLSSIVRAAGEAQRGNYDEPVELRGGDEVAFLGQRFVEMRSSLQSYVEHLQNLDKVKSNFLALAGHELKTPLTIISGFNQLIASGAMGDLPDDVKETSAVIQDHLTDLSRLVQNMLDMSALDQGICEFDLHPTDLREIAEVALRERARKIRDRNLTVETAFATRPGVALVDRMRMEQAFCHLLDNALRFTPEHGTITVGLRDEAELLLWSVKDTGIGIPAGELDWIFEKVYEVGDIMRHSSTKDQFGSQGLGLGLALCKAIVNGHGGQIRVNSGLGRGSEFTIVLRRADVPDPSPMPQPQLVTTHEGIPS